MDETINKSMDLDDLNSDEAKKIIDDLIKLDEKFEKENYHISSWYGNINSNEFYKKLSILNRGYNYKPILDEKLDFKYPSFLLWEIYWVVKNLKPEKGKKILDIGGASSLFSFYMASLGLDVVAIDLNPELADNANQIAKKLGLKYKAVACDAEDYILNTKEKFDYITSICVFEHIEINKRKRIVKAMTKILNPDGKLGFTFDYKNPSKFVNINNGDDVKEQFVCDDNLELIGNQEFYDNNKNYLLHPFYFKPIFWKYKFHSLKKHNFSYSEILKTKKDDDYSFGAVFIKMKNNNL